MPRPKTRSKASETMSQDNVKPDLEEEPAEPLKILILPKHVSPDARICTLPHPRTSQPARYYLCPEEGILEFTRIASPRSACQSWLIGRQQHLVHEASEADSGTSQLENTSEPSCSDKTAEPEQMRSRVRPVAEGYVVKSPEMLVATPIDPMFLALPSLLASSGAKSPSSKGVFLSSDDILDPIRDSSPDIAQMLDLDLIQRSIRGRMKAVCDIVEAGGEEMFRLNTDKLLEELTAKAKRMVVSGLPSSMEARFVRKALERPMMAIKREDSTRSQPAKLSLDEPVTGEPPIAANTESEAGTSTSASLSSDGSSGTNITFPDEQQPVKGSQKFEQLMRLRVALSYILAAYIPQPLVTTVNAKLDAESSPIDFKPLEKELALIGNMRREALASRSFGDFSRKRGMEDEEAADLRAEKKARKEEEEKKRKVSETRGVRDLKKVDTSGMKKMSDFFGKKPATSKKK